MPQEDGSGGGGVRRAPGRGRNSLLQWGAGGGCQFSKPTAEIATHANVLFKNTAVNTKGNRALRGAADSAENRVWERALGQGTAVWPWGPILCLLTTYRYNFD